MPSASEILPERSETARASASPQFIRQRAPIGSHGISSSSCQFRCWHNLGESKKTVLALMLCRSRFLTIFGQTYQVLLPACARNHNLVREGTTLDAVLDRIQSLEARLKAKGRELSEYAASDVEDWPTPRGPARSATTFSHFRELLWSRRVRKVWQVLRKLLGDGEVV